MNSNRSAPLSIKYASIQIIEMIISPKYPSGVSSFHGKLKFIKIDIFFVTKIKKNIYIKRLNVILKEIE